MIVERRRFAKISNTDRHMSNHPQQRSTFHHLFSNIIGDFRNMTLYKQIMICYLIFLMIFLMIFMWAKYIQLSSILDTQTSRSYYINIVSEMLNKLRLRKVELDKINYDDYVSMYYHQVVFYRIYLGELADHQLAVRSSYTTEVNSPFAVESADESNGIYSFLGSKFSIASNISEMLTSQNKLKENQIDMNLFVPILSSFVPIFYQYLSFNGISLSNFYFLGYPLETQICEQKNYQTYFKYPIDKLELNTGAVMTNNQIYDVVLDPIGRCYDTNKIQINEAQKRVNWYYQYEEPFLNSAKTLDSRIIGLLKLGNDFKKSEYFINYLSYKITAPSGIVFVMTFAQKISRTTSTIPFIIGNEIDEAKMDIFTMINYPQRASNEYLSPEKEDGFFYHLYNYDDNSTIVANIPKFLTNIYKYTLTSKDFTGEDNINSYFLKYEEMSKIWDNYYINIFFDNDSNFFELVVFLNNFLKFQAAENDYLTTTSFSNGNEPAQMKGSNEFHRCYISDLQKYNNIIQNYYNCIEDYCFYFNCSTSHPLYKENLPRYEPSCYCLPLFCIDEYTTSYPEDLANELNLTYAMSNGSFTNENRPMNFYPKNEEISCHSHFYHKSYNNTPSVYYSKISLKKMKYLYNTTMFLMFLLNDEDIEKKVVQSFSAKVGTLIIVIVIIYFCLLGIVIIIFFFCVSRKIDMTTTRIEDVNSIIKIIIKISESKDNEETEKEDSENPIIDKQDEVQAEDSLGMQKDEIALKLDGNKEKVEAKKSQNENQINLITEKKSIFAGLSSKELKMLGLEINNKQEFPISTIPDELQEFITLISDNIKDFKIEFKVNENMYGHCRSINKHFQELASVNFYRNRLFPPSVCKPRESVGSFFLEEKDIPSSSNSMLNEKGEKNEPSDDGIRTEESKEEFIENLSLDMIYELMSTEEMIDLSQLRSNFYFKEPGEDPIIDFYDAIRESLYDDESNYANEMTDKEKLANAIQFYMNEIHLKWKEIYDMKRENDVI